MNCPGLRRTLYGQRQGRSRLPKLAADVMQAKGMPADDAAFKEIVAERALTVLRRLAHKPRRQMGAECMYFDIGPM
jgi:hypothetical protein